MQYLETTGWDNPKETADTKKYLQLAEEFADEIRVIKGKTNKEVVEIMAEK